ncbi:MAG: protein phosphatase 2C-like, stage sporulation [Phycisphaerales bacterium]|nr:protein phosphatase 2C-like, stage sporulation [Phycisphaerales bacterium]
MESRPSAPNPPADLPPAVTREQMRLVLDVARMLAVTTDLDALLRRIAESTCAMLACERASIFLHDDARGELWTKVALLSGEIRIPASRGIAGHAFSTNQVIHCPDAYADPRFDPRPDGISGFRTRDLLAAPMVDWENRPLGVIQALNKSPGEAFGETDAALLRLLADQAGVAIQRWHLQQTALQTSNLLHEMELARRVQEAMIPKHPPVVPGLRAAGWTRAASINGGDCYDLWRGADGRLGVLVADASGHGIAPALVVAQVRALVRTLAETESDPLPLLWRVNERMAADLEPGRFVTAFLGFISGDGELNWCSGGHGPMFLCQPGGMSVLQPTLPPLGVIEELPDEGPPPVRLDPSGSLIVPSDGITEAFSPVGELFGSDRVIAALQSQPGCDPDAVVASIRSAVSQWQGKDEPADDQTLVVVRRQASAN